MEDPEFDPLDYLNDTPSDFSDTTDSSRITVDEGYEFEWLDFSLRSLEAE